MFFDVPPAPIPLIGGHDAVATLVLLGLGTLISLLMMPYLVIRAFPRQFTPSGSLLQYLSRRARLLLAGNVLVALNGSITFAHYYSCWQYRTSFSYIIFQAVWGPSFPILGALLTHATCQRCAMIVTQQPQARRRFEWGTAAICASIALGLTVDAICTLALGIQEDNPPRNSYAWYTDHFYTPLVIMIGTVMPLASAAGSGWALYVNIRRPRSDLPASSSKQVSRASPSTVSAVSRNSDAGVAARGHIRSPPHPIFAAASIPTPLLPPQTSLSPPATALHSGHSHKVARSVKSSLRSLATSARKSSTIMRSPSLQLIKTVSPVIDYPLSKPFLLLTIVNIPQWIAFFVINSGVSLGGVVEPFGVTVVIVACVLATEASFEGAAKIMNQSRGGRRGARENDTFAMDLSIQETRTATTGASSYVKEEDENESPA
ncbi:hypothetical protein BC828DRAFT_380203 [Blastocladiella britannica]|nr:hypothetical protein BC828DRAFT_380203 [Blastocladiella britannica]